MKVVAPDIGEGYIAIHCKTCKDEIYVTWNAGEAQVITMYQEEEMPDYRCQCKGSLE